MAHLTLVTTVRAHLAPVTTVKDLTSIAAARAHLAPVIQISRTLSPSSKVSRVITRGSFKSLNDEAPSYLRDLMDL